MEGHDSMVFTLDGKWFWNSHGLRGNALDFMQKFEGKSMIEAGTDFGRHALRFSGSHR